MDRGDTDSSSRWGNRPDRVKIGDLVLQALINQLVTSSQLERRPWEREALLHAPLRVGAARFGTIRTITPHRPPRYTHLGLRSFVAETA